MWRLETHGWYVVCNILTQYVVHSEHYSFAPQDNFQNLTMEKLNFYGSVLFSNVGM